ncbi:four-helix bundle copper-binding protein [Aquabacterium fontiphilum]|jgi:triphosphoribosyl-dephospho-CoA synthetase|uniref:four-helix bundle copper-binding protein n=1 Tax=Aquabacterium fontiphilum TaxID=450365 RepID=UPI001378463A|nr:four-helix bundle copper-binding protein [Aquabacterium fontiphilum]NBD22113.1 four-helix bundle copper-binding protein [Aquabacterium fontiphilum]
MPLDDDTTLSDDDALQCIEDCQRCHDECLRTAMQQCLEMGGEHASRDHLSLMLTCAELCQTAANAMLRGAPLHRVICQACGEVCLACADSCEALGDMDDCAEACRICADSCLEMAGDVMEDDEEDEAA